MKHRLLNKHSKIVWLVLAKRWENEIWTKMVGKVGKTYFWCHDNKFYSLCFISCEKYSRVFEKSWYIYVTALYILTYGWISISAFQVLNHHHSNYVGNRNVADFLNAALGLHLLILSSLYHNHPYKFRNF